MPAAIFMGSNPTPDGADRQIESNVPGRNDPELYGAQINVDFVERLRRQVRFEGIGDPIVQMNQNIENCRRILIRQS